jgi:hypothetical protein
MKNFKFQISKKLIEPFGSQKHGRKELAFQKSKKRTSSKSLTQSQSMTRPAILLLVGG